MALLLGPDPDFYRQQSERWGNALSAMTQIIQNKRAKEDREIQRSMELLTRNPELADTLGSDLVSRYGRKRPEIVSLVTTLQQQKKLQDESERNLSRYDKAISKEISQRQAFEQSLAQMPDSIQQAMGEMGPYVEVPNYAKQAARASTATLPDPTWSAFANMPEDQRYAALVAMRRNKIKPPEPPETLGPKDLNESLRGYLAGGGSLTSPEGQVIINSLGGLRLSPKEELKIQAAKDAAAAAQAGRLELQQGSKSNQEELLKEREASQLRLIAERDRRRPKHGEKKSEEDKLVENQIESNLAARTAGSKERKALTPDPKAVAKAKRDNKEPPQEPPPAFPSKYVKDEVKKLALEASETFDVDPDTATDAALKLYDLGMAQTHDAKKALEFMRRKMDEDKALLMAGGS